MRLPPLQLWPLRSYGEQPRVRGKCTVVMICILRESPLKPLEIGLVQSFATTGPPSETLYFGPIQRGESSNASGYYLQSTYQQRASISRASAGISIDSPTEITLKKRSTR